MTVVEAATVVVVASVVVDSTVVVVDGTAKVLDVDAVSSSPAASLAHDAAPTDRAKQTATIDRQGVLIRRVCPRRPPSPRHRMMSADDATG